MMPFFSLSIFAASVSTQTTSFPLSAKQALTTSPTYPAPITPMFIPAPDGLQLQIRPLSGKYRTGTGLRQYLRPELFFQLDGEGKRQSWAGRRSLHGTCCGSSNRQMRSDRYPAPSHRLY